MQRIAVTGASGLIGRALVQALFARGDEVVAFSRTPERHHETELPMSSVQMMYEYKMRVEEQTIPRITWERWDPQNSDSLRRALSGCDTVVNLVGASIAGKRWSEAYKQQLMTSRVNATQQLLAAIASMPQPPQTFISSSGAGYYGIGAHAADETTPAGRDFLARLCVDWEAAAHTATTLGMRTAVVRTGVVLDDHDGALPLMALPFRLFAGGPVLPGTQGISWIHRDDMVRLLLWLIDTPSAQGAYNGCAPNPVSNAALGSAIAQRLARPNWLPVPQFALQLLFGEMADALLIGGQYVTSSRLASAGFTFQYPHITEALATLWA